MKIRLFLLVLCCLFLSLIESSPVSTRRKTDNVGTHEIVKSEQDTREYRLATLSNGIRCVLVHDNASETAAVQIRLG